MQNSKLKSLMNTSGIWSINYISISMLRLTRIIRDITIQKVIQHTNFSILTMVIKLLTCIMMSTIRGIKMNICIMMTLTTLRATTFITMSTTHGMQVTHI